MRKEVDHIEEYRQELKELEAFKNDKSEMFETDDSADLEELHLRIKLYITMQRYEKSAILPMVFTLLTFTLI